MRQRPPSYRHSSLLLARVAGDGTLTLLTYAWETSLGYTRAEWAGTTPPQPIELGPLEAAALLRESDGPSSVEFALPCKDGKVKRFSAHCRFDAYDQAMFLAAEELVS